MGVLWAEIKHLKNAATLLARQAENGPQSGVPIDIMHPCIFSDCKATRGPKKCLLGITLVFLIYFVKHSLEPKVYTLFIPQKFES